MTVRAKVSNHNGDASSTKSLEVDLIAPTHRQWQRVDMLGSSGPVQLRVLRRSSSGTMSALVRFPMRWSRWTSGSYAASELFVVLDGTLHLGDLRFEECTGAFVPGYTTRWWTAAPCGALAFAHFDAPAIFVPEPAHGRPQRGNRQPTGSGRRPMDEAVVSFSLVGIEPGVPEHRLIAADGQGWTSWVLARADPLLRGPAEVLAPAARRWIHAGPGAEIPILEVPVLVLRPHGKP